MELEKKYSINLKKKKGKNKTQDKQKIKGKLIDLKANISIIVFNVTTLNTAVKTKTQLHAIHKSTI